MAQRKKPRANISSIPSREDVLAFIAENPGMAGKREIARAFGIKGSDRIGLKRILAELADEGLIQKKQKKLLRPGDLPRVLVVSLTTRDRDGELLGEPADWDSEEQGEAPRILVVPERQKRPGRQPGIGDRALVRLADITPGPEATHAARVIKVLEKKTGPVLGIVQKTTEGIRLVPIDKKQREMDVDPAQMNEVEDGDLVRVDVKRHGRYGPSIARIEERIGAMGSEKAVSMIALYAHNIRHIFPESVLEEAAKAKPVALAGREDWRDVKLITIDPPDAKDHDDAVYAEPDTDPDNPDGWIVFVAIADVAHYVQPGSQLDREAHLRGNSVYFPDRVIPMLPEGISNDLCSLKQDEDRPAMAVRMIFDKEGRKTNHRFHRVMMRSHAKFSYAQAQSAIDGVPDDQTTPLLESVLKPLWESYACVKRGRENRQPLELNLPERKLVLKQDGTVERVVVPERLDAHKLIEEFMIQANVAAAETLEKHRTALLYRIHDAPTPEKLENLREFLSTIEIRLPKAGNMRPSHFNGILSQVAETPNESLVNEIILRSQAQAEYHPMNIGHFGLNLRRYAHFTSPIRRYADLIVHRGLIQALKLGKDGLPDGYGEKLEAVGAEISATERRAMAAERDTVDRLIAMWLTDKIGARFLGRIAGVTKSGMFVRLDETGADGFIPAATIGDDYYHYDDMAHALIGRSTGETYQLGDKVEVRLVEAAPFAGALRFEVLSEGRYLKSNARTAKSKKKRFARDRRKGRTR
ncbi:MAG: ribonuclease R [Stappiaceae bacterium]